MKSPIFILGVVLYLVSTHTFSQSSGFRDKVDFNSVIEMETAIGLDPPSFQKSELIFKPQLRYKINKKLRITSIGRLYSEWSDNLEPGQQDESFVSDFSQRGFAGDKIDFEIREFYLDWFIHQGWKARIGKQQIVWGETDGLKLLDIVNPQNFREFILDEFEDSRIPLWSVKINAPISQLLDLELVWIPDLTYHIIPDRNAEFFPNALVPTPPQGLDINLQSINKPDHLINDSDIGVKASAFIGGWDLSVNYMYAYEDTPIFYRNVNDTSLDVIPSYNRIHVLGGTFNNVLGDIAIRGEIAFIRNNAFYTNDVADQDGVILRNQMKAAIGMDWTFNESLISIQFFQDWIQKGRNLFNRSEYEPSITALFRQELFNDSFTAEILSIVNIKQDDWLIRPKIKYLLTSNKEFIIGADVFTGKPESLFGQFNGSDRIYMGFRMGI